MLPPPPRSSLFPYTTLFRSIQQHYRSRARKRQLETDVPGELRLPGQHPRTRDREGVPDVSRPPERGARDREAAHHRRADRSEEHTSELQSLTKLVCRLLLEN